MHPSAFLTTFTTVVAALAWLDAERALASGAVTYRSSSCGQVGASTISVSTPAGTASGDVLIASAAYANSSTNVPDPSGWTQVPNLRGAFGSSQQLITWYRVVSGTPPASYSFPGGSGTDAISASLTAFRGVDPISPIAGTPAQSIVGSLVTSGNFPNSSGSAPSSMRYSAIGIDDGSTTTMGSGLTTLCVEDNESGTDASIGTAYEATGSGTTTTRGFTLDDNGHLALQTLVLAPLQCVQGGLNLTAPSTVSFGSYALTGTDGTRTATPTFTVDDQTSNLAGWNLSATSTTFTSGSDTLPTTAARFTGVTPTAGSTAGEARCSAPTNSVTYPVTLPAAAVAPTAVKIYNAAAATGRGATQLAFNASLAIPANTRTGTYTSTWTFTLGSGP